MVAVHEYAIIRTHMRKQINRLMQNFDLRSLKAESSKSSWIKLSSVHSVQYLDG